jgi:cyclohexyl-isocyanide hydratase
VTAGIDFALTLAAELAGVAAAQRIQLQLEYDPAPPFSAGSPDTAPPAVLAEVQVRVAQQYPERRAALRALLRT